MTWLFLQIRVLPGASPWSSLPSSLLIASQLRLPRRRPVTEVRGDLLKLFGLVTDGRSGQGQDHPVAVVLALAAAAVVAGMKGYTAIAGWVKDVPPAGAGGSVYAGWRWPARPPSKATIWRVITGADAEGFGRHGGQVADGRPARLPEQGAGAAGGARMIRAELCRSGWTARRSGVPRMLRVTSGICWPRSPVPPRGRRGPGRGRGQDQ